MAKKERIPEHLKPWIEARRRFRLSHMHIQMARELGMNPKKLGARQSPPRALEGAAADFHREYLFQEVREREAGQGPNDQRGRSGATGEKKQRRSSPSRRGRRREWPLARMARQKNSTPSASMRRSSCPYQIRWSPLDRLDAPTNLSPNPTLASASPGMPRAGALARHALDRAPKPRR
jgi:hypothetical protein